MSDDEYLRSLEVQRRNFEKQFGALSELGYEDKSVQAGDESDAMSSESDQDSFHDFDSDSDQSGDTSEEGIESSDEQSESDSEREEAPKVIKIGNDYSSGPMISKKEQKLARSGRAPTLQEIQQREQEQSKMTKKQRIQAAKEDENNLENDVKLQRLLQESHILAHTQKYSGAELTLQTLDYEEPTGKARKKALVSRMRSLASTNSATGGLPKTLESMPMSMRKGMIKSRERKIAKYEAEAKDAGIVLSKVKKGELRDLNMGKGATFASDRLGSGSKDVHRVRDRGLKINSVGRSTRNGLVISAAEISKVNGPSTSNHSNKKRRR